MHMEGDELIPLAEAMQMFHFAEVESGDIKLTDTGKQFADLGMDDRKKLVQDFSALMCGSSCKMTFNNEL